jgi:hypothetical protein
MIGEPNSGNPNVGIAAGQRPNRNEKKVLSSASEEILKEEKKNSYLAEFDDAL